MSPSSWFVAPIEPRNGPAAGAVGSAFVPPFSCVQVFVLNTYLWKRTVEVPVGFVNATRIQSSATAAAIVGATTRPLPSRAFTAPVVADNVIPSRSAVPVIWMTPIAFASVVTRKTAATVPKNATLSAPTDVPILSAPDVRTVRDI